VSASIEPGTIKGYIWSTPHADGYAFYIVIKESPLTLQHVPYSDAWIVPDYVIRGLNLADLLASADWDRQRRAYFASRQSSGPLRSS